MKTIKGRKYLLRFRPQQGLTIMNIYKALKEQESYREFPSPTGVNYYELFTQKMKARIAWQFPSPTGVNYYEF